MTDQNSTTELPEPADGEQPKAARAPRRRATKKAAAPATAVGPTAAGPTAAEPGEAEPATAAPVKTTRTRAARKQPTPARRASGEQPAGTEATQPAAAQTPAAQTPAAQPAAAEPERAPADAVAQAAPKRRRSRATKTAVAPAVVEAAEVAADPVVDQDDLVEPAAPAGIMPLFRAPEPVLARPRRAASRPAGPPRVEAPAEAEQGAPEQGAPGQGAPGQAAAAATEVADPEPTPSRPARRTRSRSRATQVDEPEAGPQTGLQTRPQIETDPDADTDPDAETGPDVDAEVDNEADEADGAPRRRRRRGGRGRRSRGRADGEAEAETGDAAEPETEPEDEEGESADDEGAESVSSRRRRRRRRRGAGAGDEPDPNDPPNTVVRVRESRREGKDGRDGRDDVTAVRGSTRLEAKKQRRREGRDAGRRRAVLSEAEFLARRESVERVMVVRELETRTQIGVLEDGVLVEHYVARQTQTSMVGNVYLGKVQNVLPSMEAAFVDIGRGRNAVLYAGEVNWDTAGLDGQPRRIEHALKSGEAVLVQVTKDPIGHKGARLTSQVSLPGRYLVYVPEGSMTGISRKLPENERARLKKILRDVVPDDAGVIVRTAAEGASEEELQRDVTRLKAQWEDIAKKSTAVSAPALLYGEPDLAIKVVRDIFNEDIKSLVVSGDEVYDTLEGYIGHVAPDLAPRLTRWTEDQDVFAAHRIDEQLAKALERKVWLPSGGSLVIDRTEAMTVVDVNTGKFTGSGGNLEETVTKNNIEAAEEIVRQLRLRDIGGIIVVDFIDMVLESNRDLVLRRLVECLGRDRTKHQVAEVTSLGLVQMTRKRVGQGLLEVFSENCEPCNGRGLIVHDEPVEKRQQQPPAQPPVGREPATRQRASKRSSGRRGSAGADDSAGLAPVLQEAAAGG